MATGFGSHALVGVLFVTLLVPVAAAQRPGSEIGNDEILEALNLHEGMTACEIGAGDGDLSIAAGRIVGPRGHVYASELGDGRVASLKRRFESSGLAQLSVVDGAPSKTNFPDGACDAVFMRNVYHHFDDPAAMNASIRSALRNGGRLAIVDFSPPGEEAAHPEDRDRDGKHGVTADSVSRELHDAGFEPISSDSGQRWFMVVVSKASSN